MAYVARAAILAEAEKQGLKPLPSMRLVNLRALCQSRRIPATGLKVDVVARLEECAAAHRVPARLLTKMMLCCAMCKESKLVVEGPLVRVFRLLVPWLEEQ